MGGGDCDSGECRRNPPSVYAIADEDTETVSACWPPVEAVEWCSQFEPRVPVIIEEEETTTQGALPPGRKLDVKKENQETNEAE
jgi:hypothetical protein